MTIGIRELEPMKLICNKLMINLLTTIRLSTRRMLRQELGSQRLIKLRENLLCCKIKTKDLDQSNSTSMLCWINNWKNIICFRELRMLRDRGMSSSKDR